MKPEPRIIRCGDKFQPPLGKGGGEYFVLDPDGPDSVKMFSMNDVADVPRLTVPLIELIGDWRPTRPNENPKARVIWIEPTGGRG